MYNYNNNDLLFRFISISIIFCNRKQKSRALQLERGVKRHLNTKYHFWYIIILWRRILCSFSWIKQWV